MNSHSVRFGLLAGIGTVLLLLTAYFVDKRLQLSPSVVWSTTILYVIGMTMAAIEERNDREGFLSFKESLKAAFIVWVIANAIYHVFNYVHFNYFDPEMISIQKEQFLEMNETASMFNEETAALVVAEMNYSLTSTIFGYISSLVGGFLLAAIIARFVRRDNYAMK